MFQRTSRSLSSIHRTSSCTTQGPVRWQESTAASRVWSGSSTFGGIISSIERELDDAVANDDHGIELLRVRAERKDGRTHEWQAIWVCHFRDGKISELWGTITDQPALDEFLAG